MRIEAMTFTTNKARAKARRKAESRLFWNRVCFIASAIEIMRELCIGSDGNMILMGIACVVATLTVKGVLK